MPRCLTRAFTLTLLLTLALALPTGTARATCGGGGGGGLGGANPGEGAGSTEVYHVPWKIIGPSGASPDGALVVYWFPTSPENARGSELLSSRYLTLSSAQCIGMALVTSNNQKLREKYTAPADQPLAVLAGTDGTELGRVAGKKEKLSAFDVEELLRAEIDKREDAAKESLDTAKAKMEQKDADGAAEIYAKVWEQRCLLPSPAKKAAKALKKLGKVLPEEEKSSLEGDRPIMTEALNKAMVRAMEAGLAAERNGRYVEAKRLYTTARRMDAADPVPARFLGELLRHHTGEWVEARAVFNEILAMHADPLSRAVALHGLGKMTIHDGEFQKGLALFEESIANFPLAMTYRNLAVYWNSEKQDAKAYAFVQKAIELDPDDEYNQIFAATYLVQLGRPEEAAEIAKRNEATLAASYNLAAIYAQLGNKEKALEMLNRHFFVYEQFAKVRAKEMQEARDDIAFARYHTDPDFVRLTALADDDASSYHRKKS